MRKLHSERRIQVNLNAKRSSTTVACFSAFFGVRWQRWTGGGDAIWTIE
jgi:hypothetical protein